MSESEWGENPRAAYEKTLERIAELEAQLRIALDALGTDLIRADFARKDVMTDTAATEMSRLHDLSVEQGKRIAELEEIIKAMAGTLTERDKRIAELEAELTRSEQVRSQQQDNYRILRGDRDKLREALQGIIKEPLIVPKNDIAKRALEEK